MIVGAPKSNYSNYSSSGAIYKCPITLLTNDCSPINIDFEPTRNNDQSIRTANFLLTFKFIEYDDAFIIYF